MLFKRLMLFNLWIVIQFTFFQETVHSQSFNIPENSVEVFDDENSTDPLSGQTDFDDLDDRQVTVRWNYTKQDATMWDVYVRKNDGGYFFLDRINDGSARSYTWENPDVNIQYQFRLWTIKSDGKLSVLSQELPMGYNLTGSSEIKLKQIANPDDIPAGQVLLVDDLFHSTNLSGSSDFDTELERALVLKFNPGEGNFSNIHIYGSTDGKDYSFLGHPGAGDIFYFRWDANNTFLLMNQWKNGPQDGETYWFRLYALKSEGGSVEMNAGPVLFELGDENDRPSASQTPTPNSSEPSSTPTLSFTPTLTATPSPSPTPTVQQISTPTPLPQQITIALPGLDSQATPLEMAYIPAGEFLMGSPDDETGRQPNEGPQHPVTITQPFYMGKYEITQAQWQAIMNFNPSVYKGNVDNPVDSVSWFQCQEFIQNLNDLDQGIFRLPTEAEWEYACRAGTTTRYYWGEDPGLSDIWDHAWFWHNANTGPKPVGQKIPNAWELYDMSGNQQEWCKDWYGPYSSDQQFDPVGPSTGDNRVVRGGFWGGSMEGCRSAHRAEVGPNSGVQTVSFRIVKEIPQTTEPTPQPTTNPTPSETQKSVSFGSTLQSYAGQNDVNESLDQMQADHLNVVRYFAHESVSDNVAMINAAAKRDMKVIMVFGCGNETFGIDCNYPPCLGGSTNSQCCDACWWNLDLVSSNPETGEFQRRYTCDPTGYADWIEYRLSQIDQSVPGSIGSTLIAIQIGNEEEGKWHDPQTGELYQDGDCYYAGRLFAEYYLEAAQRIRNRWPNMEIISGSVENDRSLDFDQGGLLNYGRWARAFLNGFIQWVLENTDFDLQQLPDIIAFNGYSGTAPPEYLHEGAGTKEWINRLDTLNNICGIYGYFPSFAVSEFGYSPLSTSNYGIPGANEKTQAVFYMRKALMDATMMSSRGDTLKYSLYWEHPYNAPNGLDTGWFNTDSKDQRIIRVFANQLHASSSQNGLGLGNNHEIWIPATSERGEEIPDIGDNTMRCAWINKADEHWGAIWRYKNNVGTYYTASPAERTFTIDGKNPGKAHLYKFMINQPYQADNTQWIQITDTPIAGQTESETTVVYDLPAVIDHSQYGSITVVNENPTFIKFGF